MAFLGSFLLVCGWGLPPPVFWGRVLPHPQSALPSAVHVPVGERRDKLDCGSCCGVSPCCVWPRAVPGSMRLVVYVHAWAGGPSRWVGFRIWFFRLGGCTSRISHARGIRE